VIHYKFWLTLSLSLCLIVFSHACLADQREFAEDIAAALCGAIGAAKGGNSAAAAGTVMCKYAVRVGDSAVGDLINRYFDGQDQKFADAACVTIHYADGKVIRPSSKANCAATGS
jgi:hypothetical protein